MLSVHSESSVSCIIIECLQMILQLQVSMLQQWFSHRKVWWKPLRGSASCFLSATKSNHSTHTSSNADKLLSSNMHHHNFHWSWFNLLCATKKKPVFFFAVFCVRGSWPHQSSNLIFQRDEPTFTNIKSLKIRDTLCKFHVSLTLISR